MTAFGDVTMWFGSTSGSAHKALAAMEEPHVMLSHAADNNHRPHPDAHVFADCGGYSMLHGPGDYTDEPDAYVAWVDHVGADQYALRDYPCERSARQRADGATRSVAEHQRRSLDGHLATIEAADRARLRAQPVVVIQGWSTDDYLECIDLYDDHGLIDGWSHFAIGSVCRRDQTAAIARVISTVTNELPSNATIHAFGVKTDVLTHPTVAANLDSADSCAWYFRSHQGTPRNRDVEPAWHSMTHQYLAYKRSLVDTLGIAGTHKGQTKIDTFD